MLVVAIVFDLIAATGLCLLALGAYFRGGALGLIFLGGALGLAALPGATASGIVLRRSARRYSWPRGRYAMTIVGLGLATLLIGPTLLALSWSATPNPAAAAAAPLEHEIEAAGGKPLCTNGDAGRGPDNFSPWHEAYFTAARNSATLQRLRQQVRSAGFTNLRHVPERASSFADAQRFTLGSTTTEAHRADLALELSPSGTQLNCDSNYGRTYRPARNQVVIDLLLTMGPTP